MAQIVISTKPKISVGFGWFFSRFGVENIFNARRTTDSGLNYYSISNSTLLDSFPNLPSLQSIEQTSTGKSSITIDSKLKTPFQTILNFNLDEDLSKNTSISFAYGFINGLRQTITRNINAPLFDTFNETNQSNAIYPFGGSQGIFKTFSKGKSSLRKLNVDYDIGDISFLKRKIGFDISYSFTKGQDNIVSGNSSYIDASDFSGEYAPSISRRKNYPAKLCTGTELFRVQPDHIKNLSLRC